jgi:hypothetical protein
MNKNILHYVFWSIILYLTVYMTYVNLGNQSQIWNTIWFINQNILVINLLIIISKLIKDFRLKIFSCIVIIFNLLLCLIEAIAYLGLDINSKINEFIISSYWIIALIYYLHVSNKRVS